MTKKTSGLNLRKARRNAGLIENMIPSSQWHGLNHTTFLLSVRFPTHRSPRLQILGACGVRERRFRRSRGIVETNREKVAAPACIAGAVSSVARHRRAVKSSDHHANQSHRPALSVALASSRILMALA